MYAYQSTEQLNMIATCWPVVMEAHCEPGDGAVPARRTLLDRYSGAAQRYLLGAVRDLDAAGDLFQEFALRLLRGDFRRANPERGRFRDYIRSVLTNLVNKHFRGQRRPLQILDENAWPESREADPTTTAPTFD